MADDTTRPKQKANPNQTSHQSYCESTRFNFTNWYYWAIWWQQHYLYWYQQALWAQQQPSQHGGEPINGQQADVQPWWTYWQQQYGGGQQWQQQQAAAQAQQQQQPAGGGQQWTLHIRFISGESWYHGVPHCYTHSLISPISQGSHCCIMASTSC